MKKAILAICSLSLIIMLVTAYGSTITKPFESINTDDVVSATVELLPLDIKVDLNLEEIGELVAILQTVEIYEKDDSYSDYAGQAVIYNLTKDNGTQQTIMAYNPFIVIDGIGYKTMYEPCEELNALGNNIAQTPFANNKVEHNESHQANDLFATPGNVEATIEKDRHDLLSQDNEIDFSKYIVNETNYLIMETETPFEYYYKNNKR